MVLNRPFSTIKTRPYRTTQPLFYRLLFFSERAAGELSSEFCMALHEKCKRSSALKLSSIDDQDSRRGEICWAAGHFFRCVKVEFL